MEPSMNEIGSENPQPTPARFLNEAFNSLRDDIRQLGSAIDGLNHSVYSIRILLYKANLLSDHVKKIHEVNSNKTVSTSDPESANRDDEVPARTELRAKDITPEMLDFARTHHGLQSKYFSMHKRLGEHWSPTAAVTHRSAQEFANLLCSEEHYRRSHLFFEWSGLFEFVYGKSVEELAIACL